MDQQGLLADKKREGRYLGDYFVFNACEIHFSGFIEALDSKGIVINSHWEPSLPNAPGKDKLWEEASSEAKRSGS